MNFSREEFCLGSSSARLFLAIQRCAVPRSREFSEKERRESLRLANQLLKDKSTVLRLKLRVFLFFIELRSLFVGGRRFCRLDEVKQTRVLSDFFDSRISLIRKGFWGLNTLVKLGVYGQPSVYPSIHYQLRAIPDERNGS